MKLPCFAQNERHLSLAMLLGLGQIARVTHSEALVLLSGETFYCPFAFRVQGKDGFAIDVVVIFLEQRDIQ